MVTSDISMNSRSKIRLTTLARSDAAGLNGPRFGGGGGGGGGGGLRGGGSFPVVADAAAASRSRPLAAVGLGLKVGIKDKVVGGGRVLVLTNSRGGGCWRLEE